MSCEELLMLTRSWTMLKTEKRYRECNMRSDENLNKNKLKLSMKIKVPTDSVIEIQSAGFAVLDLLRKFIDCLRLESAELIIHDEFMFRITNECSTMSEIEDRLDGR